MTKDILVIGAGCCFDPPALIQAAAQNSQAKLTLNVEAMQSHADFLASQSLEYVDNVNPRRIRDKRQRREKEKARRKARATQRRMTK